MFRRFAERLMLVSVLTLAGTAARSGNAGPDVGKVSKILSNSDDYRLRVGAALTLGNSGDPKALGPLEEALSDPHPSVRQAVAAALAKLGDASAIPVLKARLAKEANAPAKAALQKAIDDLTSGTGKATPPSSTTSTPSSTANATTSTGAPNWSSTKYVVEMRKVTNQTGIRGAALAAVLDASARTKLAALGDVYILPPGTAATATLATAKQKGLPVLGLDAVITAIGSATFAGDLKVQATVSFAVSKQQSVKASVEGNASSIGSTSAQSNPPALAKLQDMAVDGAVTAVMGKLPSALKAVAQSP